MEFENQQFERNIAKSKRSLMDFKKELNFESVKAGLTDFADGLKNADFEGIVKSGALVAVERSKEMSK